MSNKKPKNVIGSPGGPDPTELAERRWSVRDAQRRLAAAEFDGNITLVGLTNKLRDKRGKLTVAQVVAARRVHDALTKPDERMRFIDDVEGRLFDKRIEAQTTLADLVTATISDEPGSE